jgi:hypothetical protein
MHYPKIITNDTLRDMVVATRMLEYILYNDMGSNGTYTEQKQKSGEITYTMAP